jgi:hypothetical protein
MTCGIYKLTFSSGLFYIGKSLNIEKRWQQHFDSMQKNKSAAAVQAQYNMLGFPKTEIIYECHEDHIDLVEESLIFRMKPPLNTTFTRDRLTTKDTTFEGLEIDEFLARSTLSHIGEILILRNNTANLCETVETLMSIGEKLREIRSKEEIESSAGKRIKFLESEIDQYEGILADVHKQVRDVQAELAYHRRPWWEKLFN